MINLHNYYDDPCHFPPFGPSDHDTVTAEPKVRDTSRCTTKFVLKRASRKAELGRYLSDFDWPRLFSSEESCEDMLNIFNQVIHTGLDLLMPVKRVRVNTPDAPCMTQYKFYRNAVNRERKTSKANFYKTKVEHMKDENPKVWWKEVKRLGGASSRTGNVISQIQAEGIEDLNQIEVANVINQAFFEPMEEYRLPQALPKLTIDDESSIPEVTETRIRKTESIESLWAR